MKFHFQTKIWDTDSNNSEDFLLNPICILYIIVCLYMLFYVQSIQIKYVLNQTKIMVILFSIKSISLAAKISS